MFVRLTIALSLALCVSSSTVAENWKKADAVLEGVQKKFADIKEHAKEVENGMIGEEKREEESLTRSENQLKESAVALEESKTKLASEKAAIENKKTELESSFLESSDSSFFEIPESFSRFPKVTEDLQKLKEAEKVYKDKMMLLHQKDDELLQMANKDFSDSHKAAGLIGHFRSENSKNLRRPSSFIEQDEMPAAFQRILKAEDALRAVNDKLARDFHLA